MADRVTYQFHILLLNDSRDGSDDREPVGIKSHAMSAEILLRLLRKEGSLFRFPVKDAEHAGQILDIVLHYIVLPKRFEIRFAAVCNNRGLHARQCHQCAVREILSARDQRMILADQLIDLSGTLDHGIVLRRFAVPIDHDGRQDQIVGIQELLIEFGVDHGDLRHRGIRIRSSRNRCRQDLLCVPAAQYRKNTGVLLHRFFGTEKSLLICRLGTSDKCRSTAASLHTRVQHIGVLRHLEVLLKNGNADIDLVFHSRILTFCNEDTTEVVKKWLSLSKRRVNSKSASPDGAFRGSSLHVPLRLTA